MKSEMALAVGILLILVALCLASTTSSQDMTPRPAEAVRLATELHQTPTPVLDLSTRMERYLADLTSSYQFSGAVLVARQGRILLNKGFGMGDSENGIPNGPQTRFRIADLTAAFTAVAILMLQAQDKLDVQDPICRYLPDCPTTWNGVTVHHLLTHTSGLSDWNQPWNSATGKPSTPLQLIDLFKNSPPYSKPGETFRYSRNGYVVLGYIIERVSGQTYEVFLRQHIFDRLEMRDSGYDHNHNDVAVGYKAIGERAPFYDMFFPYSAGGLYSSVQDLYRLDRALYTEQLLPTRYLDQMYTPYAPPRGKEMTEGGYGYGWMINHYQHHLAIGHTGRIPGFSSFLMRFPEDQVTIIVLRNYELETPDLVETTLARMVFEGQ